MTMHPMTDQCSIVSRVLPPGVHLGTGLLVATWLLTTDHRSGWAVSWLLCRLICWWSLGYWQPITFTLIYLSPGPCVTLRVVHVVIFCWRHRLPMTDRIKEYYTCKRSFCKLFQGFQNLFLNSNSSSSVLTLFSSQLIIPFNRLFKRTNRLASSCVSWKAWSNWL